MKRTFSLAILLIGSCADIDEGDAFGDAEFRAVGDQIAITTYSTAYCKEEDFIYNGINFGPANHMNHCRSSSGSGYVDRVACLPCSPNANQGWYIGGLGLPTGWLSNGIDLTCMGTGLTVDDNGVMNINDPWALVYDRCNDRSATNADGSATGDICLPFGGSSGCGATEGTSYKMDGGSAMLCCNSTGADHECVQPTSYPTNPPYPAGHPDFDTCSGDPSTDGFTQRAICIPCEGFTIYDYTGAQSTGVDDDCNFGNPCGGWDMLEVLGNNAAPSGQEWGSNTMLCASGTADEPNSVGGNNCHWAQYRCGGTLRDDEGVILSDNCN